MTWREMHLLKWKTMKIMVAVVHQVLEDLTIYLINSNIKFTRLTNRSQHNIKACN